MIIKFRKFFVALIIILAFLATTASFVYADNYGLDKAQEAASDATGASIPKTIAGQPSLPAVVGILVNYALGFLGIIFFFLILYAGVRWMLAMGKTEEITKAKDILEAAAIGLIIILSAYVITKFVFDVVAGNEGGQTPTPVAQSCVGKADGVGCGDLSVCYSQVCLSKCLASFGAGAVCQLKTLPCSGGGSYHAGLCPPSTDPNIQCCEPGL